MLSATASTFLKRLSTALTLFSVLILSACGGGGTESENNPVIEQSGTVISNTDNTVSSENIPVIDMQETDKAVAWQLKPASSQINFQSVKNTHIVESHQFDVFDALIFDDATAAMEIDLSSVNTGIELRDERLQSLLFDITHFSSVKISNKIDLQAIEVMSIGDIKPQTLQTTIELHGVTQYISSQVEVFKLSEDKLIVRSAAPMMIDALAFAFGDGIDALKAIANLASIATTVPVEFTLVFERA
ncbi:MAG: YceI family protein [Pseudomonadales bacterium]|nr:YceI family protein [Pseudomonadales bacterium]